MKLAIGLSWMTSCMNWGLGVCVRSSYEGGLQPTGNAVWVLSAFLCGVCITGLEPRQMHYFTSGTHPECCCVRCCRACSQALLDAVWIVNVHVVWPLIQDLEAHKVFRMNKESNTLYISYKTKTSLLNFNCGVSPLWILGTNQSGMYKHLLSLFYLKRESLGGLTEMAELTWNSHIRAAVDGGLQSSLQRILFWNWACLYLDGGFCLREGNHMVSGATKCALSETVQSSLASAVSWLAQLSSTLTLEWKPRTCGTGTKSSWCSDLKLMLTKPPPLHFLPPSFPHCIFIIFPNVSVPMGHMVPVCRCNTKDNFPWVLVRFRTFS